VWYGLLEKEYGITIQKRQMPKLSALQDVRSYFNPHTRTFHLNTGLSYSQVGFLLCRELGFQFMQLQERPYQTPPTAVFTFEEALHNFYASYFAVALLMDERSMIRDIRSFSKQRYWQPEVIAGFLEKYEATPEMLMQRLTNLLPKHFGVQQLFFLRFVGRPDRSEYKLTKELHLAGHHAPHANFLNEHYCRRWVAIRSMEHLHHSSDAGKLHVSAQFSTYVDTPNTYFCISIAKANESEQGEYISVTIGFLADESLKSTLRVSSDSSIPSSVVHTTCERCPIQSCEQRAAPAVHLDQVLHTRAVEVALTALD
jgi:predicted transcriptional regulator